MERFKSMRKRVTAAFLAGIMAISFAACQQSTEKTDKDKGSKVNSADYSEVYKMIKAKVDERREEEKELMRKYTNKQSVFAAGVAGEQDSQNVAVPSGDVAIDKFDGGLDVLEDNFASPDDNETMSYFNGDDEDYSGFGGGEVGETVDFSDTNNQVDGIQEGDIVKTDGKYIYVLTNQGYLYGNHNNPGGVAVIKTDNGNMEVVDYATLNNIDNYSGGFHAEEMLLYNEKLIVIYTVSEGYDTQPSEVPETDEVDKDKKDDYDDEYYTEDREIDVIEPARVCGTESYFTNQYVSSTVVSVFDTNAFGNKDKDPLIASYSQRGYYSSVRMINNNIYLVTNLYLDVPEIFNRDDLEYYVPSYKVNNGERCYVPADEINLPEKLDEVQYTVIGGLDVNADDLSVSMSSNLGSAYTIYSSLDNFYVTRSHFEYAYDDAGSDIAVDRDWGWGSGIGETYTIIDKFAIENGNVSFKANGRVRGQALNQFCFDEYKGNLRVVTDVWGSFITEDEKNASGAFIEMPVDTKDIGRGGQNQGGSLYTLDASLNVLSEIHRIGYGESVKSVRFMGDIAYVVTFMQTDPLFSFDLSDPSNPIVLDELKIPGFSTYMHPWADGVMLGMGVDADEGGRRTGLKMTMFDTSDPENLKERHVEHVGAQSQFIEWDKINDKNWEGVEAVEAYTSSPVEYEHKAALVNADKNIIGFPYASNEYHYSYDFDIKGNKSFSNYAVYSYDVNDGFGLLGEISIERKNDNDIWFEFQRGLYIGDYLYAISSVYVVSADISGGTLETVQTLNLLEIDADDFARAPKEDVPDETNVDPVETTADNAATTAPTATKAPEATKAPSDVNADILPTVMLLHFYENFAWDYVQDAQVIDADGNVIHLSKEIDLKDDDWYEQLVNAAEDGTVSNSGYINVEGSLDTIRSFANKFGEYKSAKLKDYGSFMDDFGSDYLYGIYLDENEEPQYILLSVYGDNAKCIDDDDIIEFVNEMADTGFYSMFEFRF